MGTVRYLRRLFPVVYIVWPGCLANLSIYIYTAAVSEDEERAGRCPMRARDVYIYVCALWESDSPDRVRDCTPLLLRTPLREYRPCSLVYRDCIARTAVNKSRRDSTYACTACVRAYDLVLGVSK